jgi:DNA-binding protein HU-beta
MNKVTLTSFFKRAVKAEEGPVEAFATMVAVELNDTGECYLPGVGRFKIKHKPERQARNPKTGEAITVAARNVVRFMPSKELMEQIA